MVCPPDVITKSRLWDALDDDSEGREILNDVLNTAGMVASTGEEHLGTYSDAVSNVPGIQAYLEK